jgi:hypothetical protein
MFTVIFVFLSGGMSPSVAQTPDINRGTEARALVQEIERAQYEIKREFGATVFTERRSEVDSEHGHETIGAAWARCLDATGFPKTIAARESVALRLKLNPSVSLVLVSGSADEDKIEYLLDALRHVAAE